MFHISAREAIKFRNKGPKIYLKRRFDAYLDFRIMNKEVL